LNLTTRRRRKRKKNWISEKKAAEAEIEQEAENVDQRNMQKKGTG
jgi:hypothetical protein